MLRISFFLILLFQLTATVLTAGGTDSIPKKTLGLPSAGAGFGMISYYGSIGDPALAHAGQLSGIRSGYHFNVEERIGSYFALSAYGLFGHLAGNDHGPADNLNFETKISQFGIDVVFPFDNGIIMKPGAVAVPYLSLGFGMISYHPYCDSLDSKGHPYYYWNDGSIRNLPQGSPGAVIETREYLYTTPLSGPKTAMVIPLGFGIKINITDHLSSKVSFIYNYILAKDVDARRGAVSDDKYVYLNASLQYKFGKSKQEEYNNKNYDKADWAAIDNLDSDGDGVKDSEDMCPGTPKGVAVDAKGCPLDTDGDGVPDYLDMEPNTKKGAKVDEHGVKLDYKKIAEHQKVIARYDSIYIARSKAFNAAPSAEYLKEVERSINTSNASAKKPIPEDFRELDKNNDGVISVSEVTSAIDEFFNGGNSLTVDKINKLIDFFFEQ